MKISVFTFHVDSTKESEFKNLVGDYLKTYYPDAENKVILTLINHRVVVSTYDFEWMWSQVSTFVDGVLRVAVYNNILVVCESVNF